MHLRMGLIASVVLLGAGLVVRRAADLQIRQGAELQSMAEKQYFKDLKLTPKRGTIYDRNGSELAVSVEVESVWVNPKQFRRAGGVPAQGARALAQVLGVNPERIAQRLSLERYFVWIKRRVSPRQARAAKALNIPGLATTKEARRFYPNRELAAHVLGFSNVDGVGIEGVELSLNDELRGSERQIPALRDRRGHVVFSEQLLDGRTTQGDDVYLTLDKTIQHVVERELALAVQTFEAKAGSVVVVDPSTGEILALANYPTFNPNQPTQAPPSHRRNRSVTDRFEPGSTMKPFTIAGALASGAVALDQPIFCEEGAMDVADETIHDSKPYGDLTPAEVLAYSSNIGTAKIAQAMGRKRLFRVLRQFGFGSETGVPLPGETAGILRHYSKWYEMDTATIAFGQGMSVTNLQMAMATAALANGGRLMRPVLVRRVVTTDGDVSQEGRPSTLRQPVPPRISRLVRQMMTAVTSDHGTGAAAAVDGFLVGGKTGTAQKANDRKGGYAKNSWLASFVGFVPAENPRLVISVAIDEPAIAHYGGVVAGPVFRKVATASLRHLGVPSARRSVVLGRHLRHQREAAQARREAMLEGKPGTATSPASVRPRDDSPVKSMLGRTARQAMHEAARRNVVPHFEGTGIVIDQRFIPAPLAANTVRSEPPSLGDVWFTLAPSTPYPTGAQPANSQTRPSLAPALYPEHQLQGGTRGQSGGNSPSPGNRWQSSIHPSGSAHVPGNGNLWAVAGRSRP